MAAKTPFVSIVPRRGGAIHFFRRFTHRLTPAVLKNRRRKPVGEGPTVNRPWHPPPKSTQFLHAQSARSDPQPVRAPGSGPRRTAPPAHAEQLLRALRRGRNLTPPETTG